MKIYCVRMDKTFSKYEEARVSWAADCLPVCPYCKESPWHPEFEKYHKDLEMNKSSNFNKIVE